jgi:hypothetical protein
MRKAHTDSTKLAAVPVARQSSVESTAEAYGIDAVSAPEMPIETGFGSRTLPP